MNNNYDEYLKEISDESVKEALKLTFTVAIPTILKQYESEATQANVMISFSELIKSVRIEGLRESLLIESPFYQVYPEFNQKLFEWVESVEYKDVIYDILDRVTFNTIFDCIIEGLNNGTITPEDLSGFSDD